MAESTHDQLDRKPLLTKSETAELFSTTPRTIDRWLVEGVLPTNVKVRVGGSVRFRTSELLNHIVAITPETDGGEA